MQICSDRQRKRGGIVATAMFAAVSFFPFEAMAWDVVTCENCSNVYEQAVSLAKQAAQYETQLQSYGTQLRQYANMVQNTVALPMNVWSTAQGDLMQIRYVMNAGSMLGGQAASFTSRLSNIGSFTSQLSSLTAMGGQYQQWATVTQNDATQVQAALGLQQSQQTTDAQLLSTINLHSQTAQGQMQAIQAGNEMASLGVAQMQRMQVLLANEQHIILDAQTVAASRQAASDAATMAFLSTPKLPQTGGATY